jgi:dihydroflavonol-4-reductase
MIRTLLHGHRYDGSRATRELGLVYRSLEELLARAVAWYRERGLLAAA